MYLTDLQQHVLAAMKIPLLTTPTKDKRHTQPEGCGRADAGTFMVCGADPSILAESDLVKGVLVALGVAKVEFIAEDQTIVNQQDATSPAWLLTGGQIQYAGAHLITPPLAELARSPALKRALWQALMTAEHRGSSTETSGASA